MNFSFWHTLTMSEEREQAVESVAAETDLKEAADSRGEDAARPREIGGPKGPEPTRFGDWERGGRCIDF